jgi:dephospho-CoA kinase
MEFEESITFDFRAKSIVAMLHRLQELNAALNLRPSFYTIRRPGFAPGQLSLIPQNTRIILLVIGDKCAGKTTFSDHVASAYEEVRVYEASNILRSIADQEGISPNTADDALAYLGRVGWQVVAEKVAAYMDMNESRWNIVTGLRTPEELLYLKERFPEAAIILIDADPRIRFERHIRRARDLDIETFRAFIEQDEKQRQFGALRVSAEIADITINNDATIAQYIQKIDQTLDELTKSVPITTTQQSKQLSELHRCLLALARLEHPTSCDRLSEETAKFGPRVRIYNTNRALKEVPEFADRIETPHELLQYQITLRGKLLLRLLDFVKGWSTTAQPDLELPFT